MLNRTLPQRKTVIESKYAGIAGRRIPNMKTIKLKTYGIGLLVLALAMASTAAFANDQITSTVSRISGPIPIIVNNGVPSGTIRLNYTVVGNSIPCGQFATFNLALQAGPGTNGKSPTYSVELDLAQSGNGTAVQLTPSPSTFSVSDNAWSDHSTVTVSIDCSSIGAASDGQTIDGQLNVSTTPSGAHLDTISTIQVHITLAFPNAAACLKLYSFETEQDSSTLLNSVVVVEKKTGSVSSTNPGTISVDALVVNTCDVSKTFDLGIGGVGGSSSWQTIPLNNPGNATFSYNETGEADNPYISFTLPTAGTPQGQSLCLQNVTLAAGDSYLTTVHSAIASPLILATTPGTFGFSASLYTVSGCSSLLPTIVGPSNPASSTLSYTVQAPPSH
jgi:hypothetical protein